MVSDALNNLIKIFFEEANDAILIVDTENWKLVAANRYAKHLFGFDDDNFDSFTLPQFRRILKLVQKEKTTSVFSELTLDSSDFGEILVDVFAKVVSFEGKNFVLAICKNVSEQYLMSEKLVQTDKLVLLGQLSASLVHEIRNPLAAVNLNLQLLQRNLEGNKELFSYIQTALQGVERISKIIDVTLSFSRVSQPQFEPIHINSLIVMTLELINHLLKKKEIEMAFDFQNNIGLFLADTKQVQQILINLLTNAIDAIEEKGKITIRTSEEEIEANDSKFICVSIEDTGIGIPKEDLDKIFNPFFTRKPNGTGLGLPITQRLLYQYKGEIEVESEFGVGTKITIKFPEINGN